MATVKGIDLRSELQSRRQRLESASEAVGPGGDVGRLLREVDQALERIDAGTFGLCDACHEAIEEDRLLADPLIRNCLDHLTPGERRALEQDLDLASRVQGGMLPKEDLRFAGWEASFHYEPAGAVSGDYCDLVPAQEAPGDLVFLLGDVAGKGLAASMLMASLRAILRTLVDSGLPVAALMERANRLFCESTLPSHFATLVLGRASPSGDLEICNAGHLPPLVLRRGEVLAVEPTGLPVGIFCSTRYEVHTLRLERGDGLLLFTDGLSEARDRSGSEYGLDRLTRRLTDCRDLSPRRLIETCVADVRAFQSGTPRADDLTLLAIRRVEPDAS
jgi:sigma-B regulation protein RsbU (phosphoserine phosphatase)